MQRPSSTFTNQLLGDLTTGSAGIADRSRVRTGISSIMPLVSEWLHRRLERMRARALDDIAFDRLKELANHPFAPESHPLVLAVSDIVRDYERKSRRVCLYSPRPPPNVLVRLTAQCVRRVGRMVPTRGLEPRDVVSCVDPKPTTP